SLISGPERAIGVHYGRLRHTCAPPAAHGPARRQRPGSRRPRALRAGAGWPPSLPPLIHGEGELLRAKPGCTWRARASAPAPRRAFGGRSPYLRPPRDHPWASNRTTQAAIWTRELNPSLLQICSTCPSTVRSERVRRDAISLLLRPWAISRAT